jgi:hypothetical protein
MGDPARIAAVRDHRSEAVGDAVSALCLSEQHHAAVRRDPTSIEGGAHLLAPNGWQLKRQKGIVHLVSDHWQPTDWR